MKKILTSFNFWMILCILNVILTGVFWFFIGDILKGFITLIFMCICCGMSYKYDNSDMVWY